MLNGYIGRMGFLMKGIILPFLLTIILFIATIAMTFYAYQDAGSVTFWEMATIWFLAIATMLAPFLMMVLATIKRLRDMGVTPWMIFAALIPFVDLVIALCCLIIPGKKREITNA